MTFRSGTCSACSPASFGTRGATLGPCQVVPLKSLRKEKALHLRRRAGPTLCGSTGRARSLRSVAVSRIRSPRAASPQARPGPTQGKTAPY
jgi:hypothetical protein